MEKKATPVHQVINKAIREGAALTARDLKALREEIKKAIKVYTISIWAAIGLLNLVIWVPLSLPRPLLIAVAILSVLYAFSLPILRIRKHQRSLALLEAAEPGPKKRRASKAGQVYIEQVRKEGRDFVRAEVEVLENSRDPFEENRGEAA